jgi:hypothetical protein
MLAYFQLEELVGYFPQSPLGFLLCHFVDVRSLNAAYNLVSAIESLLCYLRDF